MNYTETLDFLFTSMPSFQNVGGDAYKPGLERVATFCQYLGNPQRNFYTIHVAGTNGKGSVSHMLASILQQAGYRTGLFTSPHLSDFRERIRVDGEMIPKQKVVNFVDKHQAKMKEYDLSFFEMTASLAFDYFDQSDVEVAVIETGLGGRLDATNIITPILSIVTNIGLEHTEFLGDTLEKIASEKAGIIKKSIPVVLGQRNDEYNAVFEKRAEELRQLLKEHGKLEPKHFWPWLQLLSTWKCGNTKIYMEKYLDQFDWSKTFYQELGYIATECRFGFSLDDTNESVLFPHFHYYEFVEESELDKPHKHFLQIHELEKGKRYCAYVTTYSGLFRYNMNDLVEVGGQFYNTPTVHMVSKVNGIVSMTGEKLYEPQFIDAVHKA
ncbi:MAG: GH3 auxin-responsive promoter family protein, partial [Alistipes sp.]|nr:GH3 auxin-responsive promoter family protein [Alistipes sp.]